MVWFLIGMLFLGIGCLIGALCFVIEFEEEIKAAWVKKEREVEELMEETVVLLKKRKYYLGF